MSQAELFPTSPAISEADASLLRLLRHPQFGSLNAPANGVDEWMLIIDTPAHPFRKQRAIEVGTLDEAVKEALAFLDEVSNG